ncbi:hypothetical protein [Arthrobacter psychrolactophilus]
MRIKSTTTNGSSSFSRALALLVAGTYFMEILDRDHHRHGGPGHRC